MNVKKHELSNGSYEMVVFPNGYKELIHLTPQVKEFVINQENTIMKILPKELILRIFSYLDIVSLCRCARVCKMWNLLALDGSNWQMIDLCRFQTDINGPMLENLSYRSGGFLKSISLKGCKSITDGSFKFVAMNCQNLIYLNLSGCVRIGDGIFCDKPVSWLVHPQPNVYIDHRYSTSIQKRALTLPNRSSNIFRGKVACQNLGLYCPCLVHLDLECCSNITDLSLVSLSLGCSSLKYINISWCLRLTDDGLLHLLKKLSFLEVFYAKGCSQFMNQGLEGISNCPLLTSVNIFGCDRVTDSGILRITEGCPMLKLLCISRCSRLTDVSLVCLSRNCLRLETLDVSSCSRMTDVGFVALSKNCHFLRRLDLEECVQISDNTISNLALHCPRLSHLNLSHCELLTDQSLAHLGNSSCAMESLSVVELDNCSLLTDASLVHLYGCQNLRRIELIDCQSITPGGIHRLLCHLPGLKVHAYFTPTTPPLSVRNDRRRKICKCCSIQ